MSNNLKFTNGMLANVQMKKMTKSMIMAAAPEIAFGRADKRSKSHLLETIACLPLEVQNRIGVLAGLNGVDGNTDVEGNRPPLLSNNGVEMEVDSDEDTNSGEFMKTDGQATIEQCISNFIDATGNAAVIQRICMVCSREMWGHEVEKWFVRDIRNKYVLVPKEYHPAHVLKMGMLLEGEAIEGIDSEMQGNICHDCLRSIKAGRTPPLALANGMWVGPVPRELDVLTLLERILVARYFPAAYIIKLFPKQKGAKHWPTSGLNSGVQGNVSTYKLNTDDIVDMVDVDVMPPPASILASTIGISIVGPKNMPERTMPHFVHVRRDRIRKALMWLRDNNSLYSHITISEFHLEQLPIDGVPQEIVDCLRYSDNTELLEKERAGYVVDDDDGEMEGAGLITSGKLMVLSSEQQMSDIDLS
jgi:hypothetical protein